MITDYSSVPKNLFFLAIVDMSQLSYIEVDGR